MRFCSKCGHQVHETATACPSCGTPRTPNVPSAAVTRPSLTDQASAAKTPRAAGGSYCLNCGRTFGDARSCQFCKQVEGLPRGITIASPVRRLGALILDVTILIFLLVIGYAVSVILLLSAIVGWSILQLILYCSGQSIGKYLVGLRVVRLDLAKAAGFGTMFLREAIAKPIINLLGTVTFGIVNFWLIWDKDTQELWDKVVGTIVVNDANKLTI